MTRSEIIATLAILIGCAAPLTACHAQATAPHPMARALKIETTTSKPSRVKGGDWDDKMQRITLRLKFTNIDTRQVLNGLSASVYLFGESASERGVIKLLAKESAVVDLAPRQTIEHTCAELVTRYDKTGIAFGYSYDGWAVVVKDSSGSIVSCKATSPTNEKSPEKLLELTEGKTYGRDLKPKAIIERLVR
jgi:hypothetical protein